MGRIKKTKTRGDKNIQWIEDYCRIPEGPDIGRRVKLREWQKDNIRCIYDNPAGTRHAIISFGRKNAKTTMAAFLLLLHLCGRESKHNSQLFSAAQSRDQAAIIFGLAAKIVQLSPDLRSVVIIRDTAKQLYCPERGTLYRALSAEASTAYGLSPVFIVHDELGQVRGSRSSLYEALETATGAQKEALSIVISTQAPQDSDLLSMLIDDALARNDERTVLRLYTASTDLDPFSDEAIKAANPAFGDFQNAKEIRDMAAAAKRMPTTEASYRNLVLNQRIGREDAKFIVPTVWESCKAPVKSLEKCPEVYGGLDLSAVNDLTALVLIGKYSGIWHVECHFWLPASNLLERARQDRIPYDLWNKQGFLQTCPGNSVDYDFVVTQLMQVFDNYPIRKIGFDRWQFRHFAAALERAGMSKQEIEEKFEPFGQGYQSMSPALRELEALLLDGKLAHGGHPVLTMCASNATVMTDPAGNRKLIKSRHYGRIDGMVALAMAIGTLPQEAAAKPQFKIYFAG